jgi:glycogen operon protein
MGVHFIQADGAYNFALYSKHAERVTLLLYGEDVGAPVRTVPFDPLVNKTGRIWHCRLTDAEVGGARFYAYSIDGPPPAGAYEWHRFDPDKVLVDPYARALHFPSAFDPAAAAMPGSNAGRAALGLLVRGVAAATAAQSRPFHEADTILYELHVRGFTRGAGADVPDAVRGRYAGLIAKLPYLLDLGVTAVELMPVFQRDPGARDYWGYMPLSFFAPESKYACSPDALEHRAEFHRMVEAFHASGIEIILDAVYNHTAERGITGPTYGFKGIDNSTYYLMSGQLPDPYLDLSGTGNTINCANRAVRRMIVDSMRFWVREMGVDGFRFDMASIFARDADGALRWEDPPIFGEIASDPAFTTVRLIAEPWDASGMNALGRGFPGISWQQWNGRFRDDVRRFLRGDDGMVPALMRRLYGSDDLFPDDRLHACRPWQSVNHITCHDGFTLYDLVSYDRKRNWANGQDNRDGPHDNFSWNCGWEGDVDVPAAVLTLRARQAKNFVLLLLTAAGTPLIRGGDEFLQTQGGNDNPYNQDNETSWLDWRRLELHGDMHRFVREAIRFRKRHPSLCRSTFWRDDVRWFGTGESADLDPLSRTLAVGIHGASQHDDDLYLMVNAGAQPREFVVQEGRAHDWRRVADTALESPHDFEPADAEVPIESRAYTLAAHSVVLLRRPRALASHTDVP